MAVFSIGVMVCEPHGFAPGETPPFCLGTTAKWKIPPGAAGLCCEAAHCQHRHALEKEEKSSAFGSGSSSAVKAGNWLLLHAPCLTS